VIKGSSPLFCHIITFGSLLSFITLSGLSAEEHSNGYCLLPVVLLAFGFSLMFGALFAKTYRIKKIFLRRDLKVISTISRPVLTL
jgi:gamma-aminobutyric acid type B receptor